MKEPLKCKGKEKTGADGASKTRLAWRKKACGSMPSDNILAAHLTHEDDRIHFC